MHFRTLALAAALVLPASALADHTYQVTGPVVSSSPESITVKKGSENWEIARGDDKTDVKAGDKVTITLPNGQTTPGTVTSMGKVATTPSGGSASSPTVEVRIRPSNPAATGALDQAPVQVAITTGTVHNVLAAPVNALLALAGGGYAVEVIGGDGAHRFVPVTSEASAPSARVR